MKHFLLIVCALLGLSSSLFAQPAGWPDPLVLDFTSGGSQALTLEPTGSQFVYFADVDGGDTSIFVSADGLTWSGYFDGTAGYWGADGTDGFPGFVSSVGASGFFRVPAVPEPATMTACVGLLALCSKRWRKPS